MGFLVEKLDNGIGCHYCDCADYCDRHCRDMLCPEKEEWNRIEITTKSKPFWNRLQSSCQTRFFKLLSFAQRMIYCNKLNKQQTIYLNCDLCNCKLKKPLAYVSRVRASMRHCDLKWSFFDGLSNAIKLFEKNGHWIMQTADLKIVDIGVRLSHDT